MILDTQTIVILAAIGVVLLLAVLLLFSRRQRVTLTREDIAPLEKRSFAPREVAAPAPVVEDANLEIAAAEPAQGGDPLTRIKGLGPKAAARLAELGISRFDQLAALDAAGAARIDAQMGNFRGRIARDRWVEQAALLAAGDTAAFEAAFGKLG